MNRLIFDHACFGYPKRVLVEAVSLSLARGETLCLLGPNGSGKSTLLQTLVGKTPLLSGDVRLDEQSLMECPSRTRAQKLSLLLQIQDPDPNLTVHELVELGRTPYLNDWGSLHSTDHQAVRNALHSCGMDELSARRVGTLSGGERQRARLAMVLAQETPFLLLDEPTNHLDVAHRYDLYQLLKRLQKQAGLGLLMVLHGVEDAFRFGDRIGLVLDKRLHLYERSQQAEVQALLSERYKVPTEWIY